MPGSRWMMYGDDDDDDGDDDDDLPDLRTIGYTNIISLIMHRICVLL